MNCPRLSDLPPPPPGKTGWPWTEESPPLAATMPDGKPSPKISLVTPSYNQGQFIEETLRSVLLQGYPNLEYIVIDGGSTDESVDIISKYNNWLTYWVSEPDRGQGNALNKGFEMASGEVFGWLCSDDIYASGALISLMLFRRQRPNAAGWAGACLEMREDGTPFRRLAPRPGPRSALADWWTGGFFHQPGCLFDATLFKKVGGIDETLYNALDVDLWLRMVDEAPFVALDKVVASARIYPEAKTQQDPVAREVELLHVCVRNNERQVARRRLERYGINALYTMPPARLLRHLAERTRRMIWRRLTGLSKARKDIQRL